MVSESDDSPPAAPDGQFHDQQMPTTDGELSDADAPTPPAPDAHGDVGAGDADDDPHATGSPGSFADVNAGKEDPNGPD